jgi:hypothetical protein
MLWAFAKPALANVIAGGLTTGLMNKTRYTAWILSIALLSAIASGCGSAYKSLGNAVASGSGGGSGNRTGPGSGGGSGTGGSSGSGGGSGSGAGSSTNGTVLSNLQASGGWNSWGELAPVYAICSAPCPGVTWSMAQGIQSTSLSGHATQFNLGGTIPYSDVLWSLPLIGQFSTQGLPDSSQTLLPTLHNFIYDAWIYVSDASATQALEFDVNMYMSGVGMTWGNQCRIAGGNEWDIWDNVNAAWVPTGVACNPILGGWNHVTIQVQREADNTLLFQSIKLRKLCTSLQPA